MRSLIGLVWEGYCEIFPELTIPFCALEIVDLMDALENENNQ